MTMKSEKYRIEEVDINGETYYEIQVLLASGYCVCSSISGHLRFKNERMAEIHLAKLQNTTFHR